MLETQPNLSLLLQVGCIVMLTLTFLTLAYVLCFAISLVNKRTTLFTKVMVILITVTLLMAQAEYIITIMATMPLVPGPHGSSKHNLVSPNPKAYQFVFSHCGLAIGDVSDVQQLFQWLVAMILAWKYHSVAI